MTLVLPRAVAVVLLCVALAHPARTLAQSAEVPATPPVDATAALERWNAKFQATWVRQIKPAFDAAYSGPNSLSTRRETSYSFTATGFFGFRPWRDGEFYFNPEAAQGVPLSGLTGLGGFSNGEMARTAGPNMRLYHARIFLRQTWDLGGGRQSVASDANQLAGAIADRRFVFTVGNLSALDLFDDNSYSHDPRTQFLNWSLMTHGAYDYAADARGYSWGVAAEWFHDAWAARVGRFAQPQQPNQNKLDHRILDHYGDQVELEHGHVLGGQPGRLRLLAFRNRARMARFQDALDHATLNGGTPDIAQVRHAEHVKWGGGVNVEQRLGPDAGVFARASWADGRTETYAFTEIDRSVSGGVVVQGSAWRRGQDAVGFAIARNGLSPERRRYLEAGGISFFIGDGALRYRPETVLEAYYNLGIEKHLWVTLDAQRVFNPAYNGDRGPVTIGSLRLHTEF